MKVSSWIAILLLLGMRAALAQHVVNAPSQSAEPSISVEVQRLFEEDQADRVSASAWSTDWERIGMRDEARELRVKELIRAGLLQSGADYFHAAMILQHASEPDDFLLAHDLCVVAISKGEERAKWLAAASLDRFLTAIGRPQRFGTQFISRRSFHPPKLAPLDPDVPDHLRRELNVPSLEAAKAREAAMAKEFEERRRETQVKKTNTNTSRQ